mgnify:CR=1 FL=1
MNVYKRFMRKYLAKIILSSEKVESYTGSISNLSHVYVLFYNLLHSVMAFLFGCKLLQNDIFKTKMSGID